MTSSLSYLNGPSSPEIILPETLADLFRESVQKFPSKTALIFKEKSLSYQELDQLSNGIAHQLLNLNIGRGCRVGVYWPRGLELHAIILAIVKVGAAYVPLDYEMPTERVQIVLSEVEASACFSYKKFEASCPLIDSLNTQISDSKITFEGPKPYDWAYVLYTSGSTGKPKGIPIKHEQICHLVRAEQEVFKILAEDKVYQGFSVSFDMWCEETWITYLVGATLFVVDALTAKSVDELSSILRENEITILHAVPSLLAVMDNQVPSIRLINAGGEACTPYVLERWANNNRQFFNSYGPTETTVSASIAKLKQGEAITIGRPLANYGLAVVDEELNLVARGQAGELIISGPGVSEGYVGRPDLSQEKFISKPNALKSLHGNRIYRTGDAAIMREDGNIDFQGRLDDQVKLRGYRIELGEIEARLNTISGVLAACVALKKDFQKQDQLVAYVLLKEGVRLDISHARAELAKHLPPYMLPSFIAQLKEMPRLASGKIDRKSLPTPTELIQAPSTSNEENVIDASSSLSERLLIVLKQIFPERNIDLKLDFFDDLGGHSLLAADFVSRLRSQAHIPQAALKDIYLHRPLNALVEEWGKQASSSTQTNSSFLPVKNWKYFLCGIAQSISLLFIYSLFATQLFLPYLTYYYMQQEDASHWFSILAALSSFCILPPFFSTLSIVSKWIILGKTKPGDYPLWGFYYFRWWLVKTIQKLMFSEYINGTPLYPLYLRTLGMKVPLDAQLSSMSIGAEDLITIGKDVSISSNVVLNNAIVEEGLLKIRKITLGNHAYLGTSVVVDGGCEIEDWGELHDLSHLSRDTKIPTQEIWEGSPAKKHSQKRIEEFPQPLSVSRSTFFRYTVIYLILLTAFPFTVLIPLLPSVIALSELDDAASDYNFNYLIYTPLLALSYIVLFALEAILLTRLLQRNIKAGSYPVYSSFYLKKWFSDQMMSLSLFVLHPIYATVYVSSFFRALGAKIGKNTEISTASQVTHPLLEIGEGAFIADAVTLGEAEVRGQRLTLSHTGIGNKSFVGNSALIPQGYHLPDDMLVGVLSLPPTEKQLSHSSAKTWFGSPALALPRRQESNPFPKEFTTSPPLYRRLFRAAVELIRILLPSTIIMCLSVLFIAHAHDLIEEGSLLELFILFPYYYLFFVGLPSLFITALLKWLFVGRYKTTQIPMWTWKVWRSEAITTTYEALAVPFLLEYLKGTFWLPLALKLFGVKTGARVWLNTTDITEFDMVKLEDDVAFNLDSGPQTHLFEDRVMKIGSVSIGKRSSIGSRAIILYDTELGSDTKLEPLSLVMKGEKLTPGLTWSGSPLNPIIQP